MAGSKVTYTVAVKTSDIRGAGTDAEVYIQLIGKGGRKSQDIHLEESRNHKDKFERASGDVFSFPETPSVGELEQQDLARKHRAGPRMA